MKAKYLFWMFCLLFIVAIRECNSNNSKDESKLRIQDGCMFNGKFYQTGSSLNLSCFNYHCKSEWTLESIDYTCDSCSVYMDPHVYSFDKRNYPWHGFCNYTLAQPYDCSRCSYNPEAAVYGDFKTCSRRNMRGSCVDTTTYKVDSNTVVTIVHDRIPYEVEINGRTFSFSSSSSVTTANIANEYPIIVSKINQCLDVAGSMFSLKACSNGVYIYTKQIYLEKIHGLCGFYTGNPEDDWQLRGTCKIGDNDDLVVFASSWLTLNQKEDCCPEDQLNSQELTEKFISLCSKSDYEERCVTAIRSAECPEKMEDLQDRLNNIIENCIEDCCLLPDSCDEWIKVAYEVANEVCEMQISKLRSRKK